MKSSFFAVALAFGVFTALPCGATESTLSSRAGEAKRVVRALTEEKMGGRGNGSLELDLARDFIRRSMESSNLLPGVRLQEGQGIEVSSYLQSFRGPNDEEFFNVIGLVPGTGDEWVVVGAHYDHLGVVDEGGPRPVRYPGADDNASGVAGLLQIGARVRAESTLARGVAVVAFAGEEIGLLGSKAFCENPPFPVEKIVAMLNLDTIGRMQDQRLVIFGSGTAVEFPGILRGINFGFGLDLALNSEGPGASDHTPFFERAIPVLHFFSGANVDYHKPTDTPDKVNADGIARIADFAGELAVHLAVATSPLTFVPAGADKVASRTGGTGKTRRVSLGTIPDFAREKGGVQLSGVMPKSAAEEAGLASGDVIVEIDGIPIDNIDDFQGVLAGHAPGDVLKIRFTRAGVAKSTEATLRERK